jgi:hypothetical protein
MPDQAPRFKDALLVLARHEVAFVIVGGVAAVLNGVPIATFDVDIVHARDAANIERLIAALAELDARYRDPLGRVLRPDPRSLGGAGHHLFITKYGPLDVLGAIGRDEGYDDLAPSSRVFTIGGAEVRALDLPALIRTKEAAGREKDRAVLAILRRTAEERDKPRS